MTKEKLRIIEYMTIGEFKKEGILAKEGYHCSMELMGNYVYIEYFKLK